MTHLSDDALQAYLDGEAAAEREAIAGHLRECRDCREKLTAYRHLYHGLGQEEGFLLSASFSDAVMDRIEARSAFQWDPEYLVMGSAVAAVIIAGFFLIDVSGWGTIISERLLAGKSALVSYLPIVESLNLNLLSVAALILVSVAFLDRYLLHSRHR